MRQHLIEPPLFSENRRKFFKKMKSRALAIFHSNDFMPRNGDQNHPYRQNSDFFYLTGVSQPNSILILFPTAANAKMRTLLFIEKTSARHSVWEGEKINKEIATSISGIENVYWLDQYQTILLDLMSQCDRIYINGDEGVATQQPVPSKDMRMAKKLMDIYPFHKYQRSQPLLRKIRMRKSASEIKMMKEAIRITKVAFTQIISRTWVDKMEYKLEAVMTGTFINEGAMGHAFEPIVASGASACILHYTKNNQCCQDGDLILLDFGAEYQHYAADISRTIPANGRFTTRQKEVYEAVLEVLRATLKLLVPGAHLSEIKTEVGKLMSEQLVNLGLLTDEEAALYKSDNPPYKKYFMHGVSHHLGLDVHDLSDRFAPLQSGMVLTCEPGIYIASEGIGVRLENNILVTDETPIDLTEDIPIEISDIENCMRGKGY